MATQHLPESFGEGAFIPDAWLLWLSGTYEPEGPLPRNEVADLAKEEMNAAAEEGLRRVLDDLERLHGTPPDIWLVDDDAVRVVSRGGAVSPEGITTPSIRMRPSP